MVEDAYCVTRDKRVRVLHVCVCVYVCVRYVRLLSFALVCHVNIFIIVWLDTGRVWGSRHIHVCIHTLPSPLTNTHTQAGEKVYIHVEATAHTLSKRASASAASSGECMYVCM